MTLTCWKSAVIPLTARVGWEKFIENGAKHEFNLRRSYHRRGPQWPGSGDPPGAARLERRRVRGKGRSGRRGEDARTHAAGFPARRRRDEPLDVRRIALSPRAWRG